MNMQKDQLNEIYKELHLKAHEIANEFAGLHNGYEHSMGWYNGHYFKNEAGEYQMDFFPIPVISVHNICDIEISLDGISISTKLKKDDALIFDYSTIEGMKFEAYGVNDYLADFYTEGMTIEELISNIQESKEAEIGLSFFFDKDTASKDIYGKVSFLCRKGFYY